MNKEEKIAIGIVAVFAVVAIGVYGYFMSIPPQPVVPLSIFEESPVTEEVVVDEWEPTLLEPVATTTKGTVFSVGRVGVTLVLPNNWSQPEISESDFTREHYDGYVAEYGPIVNDVGAPVPYEKVQQEMTYVDTSFDSRINMRFEARKVRPDNYLLFLEISYPDTKFIDIRVRRDYWEKAQGQIFGGVKWVCNMYLPEGTFTVTEQCETFVGDYAYTTRFNINFFEYQDSLPERRGTFPTPTFIDAEALAKLEAVYPAMVQARQEYHQILSSVSFR